jgi:hypothetical protein
MRAIVQQGADLPLRIAVKGKIVPGQARAGDRISPELAARQNGMPMV